MTDPPESGPYRLALSTSHLLHRAEQLAADRFTHLVGDTVTLRQFAVLAAVAETPGLSQIDLVRATGIDRSTLAEMMTRMEKRGLIGRATSEADGRVRSVTLTADGRAAFHASIRHARAADAAILDMLPRTKAKSLQSILMKLSKLADEAAAKAERAARRQAKREARSKKRDAKRKAREDKESAEPKRDRKARG
ncbi:MAG TPA: MarR family transcriptional regulator [Vitreimonas sp.]|nr:MarR family transcriptional regulator [Vitreimonas sp.]